MSKTVSNPMTPKEKRDKERKWRESLGLRVYVVGGGYQYLQMFHEAGFLGARSVRDADIICFTGGEDVHPSLYNEKPLTMTHSNKNRDDAESDLFWEGVGMDKLFVGICRGAQLLNVLNGGKLWQHVNNHGVFAGHAIKDVVTGEWVQGMTSTHHQMMIPSKEAIVVALAEEATVKMSFTQTIEMDKPKLEDAEVLFYPMTRSLCFQPHPEYDSVPCRDYFLEVLDHYLLDEKSGNSIEVK